MVVFSDERTVFFLNTALLLVLWLILAVTQWLIVCLFESIRDIFLKDYWICLVIFLLAILLFAVLFFIEKVRVHKIAALLLTVIIAELQIISLFTIVAKTDWDDMLLSFVICVVLLFVIAVIGIFLPKKLDLTPHLPMIFMVSYVLLLFAIFFLIMHMHTKFHMDTCDYSFLSVEVPITVSMLLFIMYQTQTISGGRFAEMSVDECHLASLILFHEFLVIYWLTFYWLTEHVRSNYWHLSTMTMAPKTTQAPEERKKFTLKTFLLLVLWLILALIQWLIVCLDESIGKIFLKNYGICIVTFLLAILLFTVMLFIEKLRVNKIAALVLTVIIAELQIISLFTLVAHAFWSHLLLSFLICVVLLIVFAAIGKFLPEKFDLTLHIALIFIVSFLLLIIAMFYLMMHMLTGLITDTNDFSFILVQIPITVSMLLFIMYHTQTISGGRFDEMSLDEFFCASLILFHDFLIIFWLSFNWLINYLQNIYWAAAQKSYE